jgi:hypothetical protein
MSRKLSLTERKVIEMLKENTGSHFLDSGGAYGRHHERNQKVNFPDSPYGKANFNIQADGKVFIDVTVNLYHWLTERLDYDKDMQRRFDNMVKTLDEDMSWFECVDKFPTYLKEKGFTVTGLYGDSEPMTINTYNHESILSQVIQFVYMEVDDTPYIILQIHNGCDVRGGYTAPKIFRNNGNYDEACILNDADASICCKNGHIWYTSDGYYWESNNGEERLEKYEGVEVNEPPSPDYEHPDLFIGKSFTGDYEYKGKLAVNPDTEEGYCPICGEQLYI